MGVSSPTRYAVRLLGAALAGICLWLAFPTHDLWWLAPVGVGLLALVTLEAGWWCGLGLGLVAGLGCFVPVLSWSGTYVGTLPWMALSTLQALYVALMSALVGYAGRRLLRAGHRGWALALVPPAWVVMEWARSTTPSSARLRAKGGIEPGAMPPTSAWCPRLATKKRSAPCSSCTGEITVMSGRCEPPAAGSLVT